MGYKIEERPRCVRQEVELEEDSGCIASAKKVNEDESEYLPKFESIQPN